MPHSITPVGVFQRCRKEIVIFPWEYVPAAMILDVENLVSPVLRAYRSPEERRAILKDVYKAIETWLGRLPFDWVAWYAVANWKNLASTEEFCQDLRDSDWAIIETGNPSANSSDRRIIRLANERLNIKENTRIPWIFIGSGDGAFITLCKEVHRKPGGYFGTMFFEDSAHTALCEHCDITLPLDAFVPFNKPPNNTRRHMFVVRKTPRYRVRGQSVSYT